MASKKFKFTQWNSALAITEKSHVFKSQMCNLLTAQYFVKYFSSLASSVLNVQIRIIKQTVHDIIKIKLDSFWETILLTLRHAIRNIISLLFF